MGWLTLLKFLVSSVEKLLGYLSARQLLDAGASREVSISLQKSLEIVVRAEEAARAVDPTDPAFDDDYARRVREHFERPRK